MQPRVGQHLSEVFAQRTFAEWVDQLQALRGTVVTGPGSTRSGEGQAIEANGCIVPVLDAEGVERKVGCQSRSVRRASA